MIGRVWSGEGYAKHVLLFAYGLLTAEMGI